MEFRNAPKGNLIIVKQDSVTKEPLEGVEFKITYADGSYVDAEGGTLSSTGLYRTDKAGKITISGISGTVWSQRLKRSPVTPLMKTLARRLLWSIPTTPDALFLQHACGRVADHQERQRQWKAYRWGQIRDPQDEW